MIEAIPFEDLVIPENRQRREFDPEQIVKLAQSITSSGLIHPVVVRREANRIILVAGELRVKAIITAWNFGELVKCAGRVFDEPTIPCINLEDISPLEAYEIELEENIRRVDLSWQERVNATASLRELRIQQAIQKGLPPPTIEDISVELRGNSLSAREGFSRDQTRKEILIAKHLNDPDVSKAKSVDEGFKILKRKEDQKRNEALAAEIGPELLKGSHELLKGNCVEILKKLPYRSFDVILSDPPYGIDAQNFGNADGKAAGGAHFYDDSFKSWSEVMEPICFALNYIAKPQAHAYLFCDLVNFPILKEYMLQAQWQVFRTPLIWINPTSQRAPWPQTGPHRKYQCILYAVKGNKPILKACDDVIICPSDVNLGHQAQKPVGLFRELLSRSAVPGDRVIDPFCGSGPIFPAAHSLKCFATGIEMNEAAFGIASKRIEELS